MGREIERYQNEIKYGAKLVVREGQMAAFINEGKLADVFKPGTYDLTTQNLPILTRLLSLPWGFTSPFRAEVYFVNLKVFTNMRWGTRDPVAFKDTQLGLIRLFSERRRRDVPGQGARPRRQGTQPTRSSRASAGGISSTNACGLRDVDSRYTNGPTISTAPPQRTR